MMGLFSMLFGVSVLLYAAKPGTSDRARGALWFRRMFWLLLIGLVHAYLIGTATFSSHTRCAAS